MRREHPRPVAATCPPRAKQAVVRAGPGSSCPTIVATGHRRDRPAHRPAARPEAHGRSSTSSATRRWSTGSSATSASKELRLMVNFGFLFGFLLGIPVAVITHFVIWWWLLPVLGIVVGWTTNLLGMWLIFEPLRAAADRADQAARPVPAPPGRGRRGVRRRSSPTTSSRSRTSATSCSTARAATAPGRCSRRRCGRPSTAPPGRLRRRSASRSERGEYDNIRESVAQEAVERTLTGVPGPRVQPPAERADPRAGRAHAPRSCRPRTSSR